jgi:dihydroorotate dehydrogenase
MLWSLLKPLLFQLNAESAHDWGHRLLSASQHTLLPISHRIAQQSIGFSEGPPEGLRQTFWGHTFSHPLGLAAGFDKNATLLKAWPNSGFSFAEVGSISPLPWPGNPKPRLFRLPKDDALINRMGLGNHGLIPCIQRLKHLPKDYPVGINLVQTPQASFEETVVDFTRMLPQLAGIGAYWVWNISCPNTADGKSLESPERLHAFLAHMRQVEADTIKPTQQRPWLIKLSTDTDTQGPLDDILSVGQSHHIAGWVLGNTSTDRVGLRTPGYDLNAIGKGGLSGAPINSRSTVLLSTVYNKTRHWQVPPVLIGVGGVMDAQDAWLKITHGASLVQSYTGWVYGGPYFPYTVQSELYRLLQAHHLTHIQDAIGSAFR